MLVRQARIQKSWVCSDTCGGHRRGHEVNRITEISAWMGSLTSFLSLINSLTTHKKSVKSNRVDGMKRPSETAATHYRRLVVAS